MRTDNDSWDITTSVGSTALFVAAARALEAQKPDPVAVDAYAEVFCRAVGGSWAAALDHPEGESSLRTEDFGTHFVNFQGARTRWFDEFFAAAASDGVRQFVILAAGLDSRAYRLPWPDGTVIYELDQPRVLDFKREVLDARGESPTATRVEVAVDLRDDWPAALRAAGFDPAVPSAFVAEGLMIYLPATAQGQLFAGIDALTAPGSHVGIEEGEPMPTPAFEAAKAAERAAGGDAVFFALVYNEKFADADQWFGAHGWDAARTPLAELLTALGRTLPPAGSQAAAMINANTLVKAIKT